MSALSKTALLITLLLFISSNHAGISPENLPSMDNLGELLKETNRKEVEQAIRANNGRISSGLPVPIRGTIEATATEIASLLSGGDKNQEQQLKKAIVGEREAFKKVLNDHGFDTRDMGVAYAVSFITLWELASHKQLPLEGSLSAGEFLVHTMKKAKTGYAAISAQEKVESYDWLMTTPVAFASLVKGFEQAGRIQEAEQLRSKSASLFKELFKLPHEGIVITPRGDIEVNAEKLVEYGGSSAKSDADTLIDEALNMEQAR